MVRMVNMCQQQCPIHLKMNGVLVNQVPAELNGSPPKLGDAVAAKSSED